MSLATTLSKWTPGLWSWRDDPARLPPLASKAWTQGLFSLAAQMAAARVPPATRKPLVALPVTPKGARAPTPPPTPLSRSLPPAPPDVPAKTDAVADPAIFAVRQPVHEFDAFGFLPGGEGLWLSRLVLGGANSARLHAQVDFVPLHGNASPWLERLMSRIPPFLSWFSGGLHFSADGSRVAFIPAQIHASERMVSFVSLTDSPAQCLPLETCLPLGSPHGRFLLSPDGHLCALEREESLEVWDLSGFPALLGRAAQGRGLRAEALLYAGQQFCILQHGEPHGALAVQWFKRDQDRLVLQASRRYAGAGARASALPTPGCFTLLHPVSDTLATFDLRTPQFFPVTFARGFSQTFAPCLSPSGRLFAAQERDEWHSLLLAGFDETNRQWKELLCLLATQRLWRSALFSPDDRYVALTYEQRPTEKALTKSSGVCVLALKAPYRPHYLEYAQPILHMRFNADASKLAIMSERQPETTRAQRNSVLHVLRVAQIEERAGEDLEKPFNSSGCGEEAVGAT